MKIIKQGKPYRKHKCSKCKTVYVYHIKDDVIGENMLYCPICGNYMDFIIFDKKITYEKYQSIKDEIIK